MRAFIAKPIEINPSDLVDDYSDAIYKFCRKLTFSKEDAEDLFQETFLKALEQPSKISASDNPKSFLFSTALYLWKSKKRTYARRNRLAPIQSLDDEIISDISIEDDMMAQEDTRLVQELVQVLPEKFKIPIILYYTMEMTVQDIAVTIRIPQGTVKSRLHKARQLIEKGLIQNGYGE